MKHIQENQIQFQNYYESVANGKLKLVNRRNRSFAWFRVFVFYKIRLYISVFCSSCLHRGITVKKDLIAASKPSKVI